MAAHERAEHIGAVIRQLRRQRNLTQGELGATRYSKSYVSAVEKNIIRPSSDALRFFAKQLNQPDDYFIILLEHPDAQTQDNVLLESLGIGYQAIQDQNFPLLDLLLSDTNQMALQSFKVLPPLTLELLATLPPSQQARYFLLQGMMALTNQQYDDALPALERSLPLAPTSLQPAVLDALGQYYHLTQSYTTALHYHLRALTSLQSVPSQEMTLLFPITLHCGEDYRILGAYAQACAMYERASKHLGAEHEMKRAALLYSEWGYCSYALTYQTSAHTLTPKNGALVEEMKRGFQRAMELVLQSKMVYQAGSDHSGEITAALLLTEIALDFSTRWRQLSSTAGTASITSCLSLLDEAEEQCHQVMHTWQDTLKHDAISHNTTVSIPLAYLVRIFIQRATLNRLSGQADKALQEQRLAVHLCQGLLDTLGDAAFPHALLQEALSLRVTSPTITPSEQEQLQPPQLRLPNLTGNAHHSQLRLIDQVEIYCAAAEVAGECGRASASSDDAHKYYAQADHCFHTAFTLADKVIAAKERDPGYLTRCYQRYICFLEERSITHTGPRHWEATRRMLQSLLQSSLINRAQ